MMIKLVIDCTGRSSLKEKPQLFEEFSELFGSIEEAQEFLVDRYGKMPAGRNKIYIDRNGKPEVVGFTHSYWNSDISHNSKPWYQTDWVSATYVVEVPVDILSGKSVLGHVAIALDQVKGIDGVK